MTEEDFGKIISDKLDDGETLEQIRAELEEYRGQAFEEYEWINFRFCASVYNAKNNLGGNVNVEFIP